MSHVPDKLNILIGENHLGRIPGGDFGGESYLGRYIHRLLGGAVLKTYLLKSTLLGWWRKLPTWWSVFPTSLTPLVTLKLNILF